MTRTTDTVVQDMYYDGNNTQKVEMIQFFNIFENGNKILLERQYAYTHRRISFSAQG